MDPLAITRDLIRLSSYKRESEVGQYIYNYLQQFSWLKVTKQRVAPGRFNVVATTPGKPQLLLAGHMDTVVPKEGSNRDPLEPFLEGKKLYGLGAYDMKGGIAAILSSLSQIESATSLSLLFYCDEEYDFAGMKKFLEVKNQLKPQLALIAEPTDLQIWNEHRGLIELSVAVRGISGHAANPNSGINAIAGLQDVLSKLKAWLSTFRRPTLGAPSLNVAYFQGGLYQGEKSGRTILGKDGNNIPDYAEAVLDIRPTKPELRAQDVVSKFNQLALSAGLTVTQTTIKHDFGALYTNPTKLKRLESIVGNNYLDASSKGYGDGQLLQAAWKIPVAYLGPLGGNAHAPNEWVDTDSLQALTEMYVQIIKTYCPT